jgi:hypothetical protein
MNFHSSKYRNLRPVLVLVPLKFVENSVVILVIVVREDLLDRKIGGRMLRLLLVGLGMRLSRSSLVVDLVGEAGLEVELERIAKVALRPEAAQEVELEMISTEVLAVLRVVRAAEEVVLMRERNLVVEVEGVVLVTALNFAVMGEEAERKMDSMWLVMVAEEVLKVLDSMKRAVMVVVRVAEHCC